MDSNQTLHDFVLNLITNSEARSAFQLDPEGTLQQAGLSDITAADVQDVVPLVVDYAAAPTSDLGLLPAGGETDLAGLGADPTDVIGQLQAVTQRVAAAAQPTSFDGNLAAAGAVAFDASTFGAAATLPGGVGVSADPSGASADLSGAYDTVRTVDSGVIDPVVSEGAGIVDPSSIVDPATGAGLGAADGLVDDLLGTVDSTGGGLTSQLDDPLGLVDSVTGQAPGVVPDLGLGGGSPVDGATGAVGGTLDGLGAGGLLGGGVSSGGVSASASGDATVTGSAGSGTGSDGLLDGATDILF